MKSPYVNELKPDQVITSSFLVCSKEIRQNKKGDSYLSLQLGDRTGELDAKMFDKVAEVRDAFERDDFVEVKGLIQIFHNRPQLTLHTIHRLDERQVDFTDYFPASARDPREMWVELRQFAAAVANPHLARLLAAILDDEEIAARYRRAPAAKQIHHAYLGGLLEHVLSLCALARVVASHYPNIDPDLLITGVILHDLGKIYELSYDRAFSYSDEGQLLGHMLIAVRLVGDKLRAIPDFPPRLRTLVEHMIISHHGELEYGSPKTPVFPEALLLHHLDNLDSKMECMRHLVAADQQVEGNFTGYSQALERTVLKKEKYLQEPAAPRAAAPPAAIARVAAAPRTGSPFAEKLLNALHPEEVKK